MYTIFIEYKINPIQLKEYLALHRQIQQSVSKLPEVVQYSWKRAVDQENLFVESIEVKSLALYHEWKRMLKEEDMRFPWHAILYTTAAGRQKFNMWAFEAVPLSELI